MLNGRKAKINLIAVVWNSLPSLSVCLSRIRRLHYNAKLSTITENFSFSSFFYFLQILDKNFVSIQQLRKCVCHGWWWQKMEDTNLKWLLLSAKNQDHETVKITLATGKCHQRAMSCSLARFMRDCSNFFLILKL